MAYHARALFGGWQIRVRNVSSPTPINDYHCSSRFRANAMIFPRRALQE